MRSLASTAIVGPLLASFASAVPSVKGRDVDQSYPYNGPDIPVGDWVDPTVNGNGKGFPRLIEAPAVVPDSDSPTNNVNVISLAYVPNGVNIHYQTPFGLGEAPSVQWGKSSSALSEIASGSSHSYDRTPPCSMIKAVTQCSQFFHEVQITGLEPGTTYYYQIPSANGTTASDILSFKTARAAGDKQEFSVAVINDMGYTNAQGSHKQLLNMVDDGVSFAWHGGDISYADDWYSGILPCEDDWPLCYNGTETRIPGSAPVPDDYDTPLPEGEIPNQGSPRGGDMSVIYESNWDLWQQWMVNITSRMPYMVLPGNHESACAEFDGGDNQMTAYLNNNQTNSTADASNLNYYSCPPSQRNFTAFQHRFRMPGEESGGVGNFWYSFDYGLAHFVSIDGETDYPDSPEWSFARDKAKSNSSKLTPEDTWITDAGPFGAVDGDIKDNKAYEQWRWLQKDLSSVDRSVTPWVIVMSHRPLYSSEISSYQEHMRSAWEDMMLEHKVDAYIAGHIHWYERLWPLGRNGTVDKDAVVNNNTYYAGTGNSLTHLTNGAAGNIESHTTLKDGQSPSEITNVLDFVHFGVSKLTVVNETMLKWNYIHGDTGAVGDELTLLKKPSNSGGNGGSNSTATGTSSVTPTSMTPKHYVNSTAAITSSETDACDATDATSAPTASVTVVTETVMSYTTYCPGPTTFRQGSQTYTATAATALTITDCPCIVTRSVTSLPTGFVPTGVAGSSGGVLGKSSTKAGGSAGSTGYAGSHAGSSASGSAFGTTMQSAVPTAEGGQLVASVSAVLVAIGAIVTLVL